MPDCVQCGEELGSGSPAGLCAKCLIQGALDSSITADEFGATTIDAARTVAGDDDFGRYEIVRPIGEGGMGTVYLAEQRDPVRRTVAIKVVKLGMDTKEVLARFANERQALAIMDHPNIARIFDAGATPKGRPYFVMEYIEGLPITQYCDGKRMAMGQRLDVFLSVCRAVEHAHRKGVIHRDLKPSNVLVTELEGSPLAKVIDFGIAKATDQWAIEKTLYTRFGQMVGTPEYASPEQAEMTTGEIDKTSDVYSLGVILYELLSGTVPFDAARLRGSGYVKMLQIIREEEAPPLSRKLAATGDAAAEIAARRQTTPASLLRVLHGDLNRITAKALEKSRERRYASVADLAADINRFIDHRPVMASPPSRVYRSLKFLRRHRPAVLGMIAGLVFILASGVTVWSLLHRDAPPPRVGLTDKDTIVLADFTNTTGDAVFDGTLRQGLAIQLEQSPFLKIMDDEQVQQDLRFMSIAAASRITNQIAHDICVRDGAAATIDGSIGSLGKNYVITLEATTCRGGATLAREQIQAADKEHVLSSLGTAAAAMRAKLGESFNSIQKLNRPLERATTPSLEALQNYTEGLAELGHGQFPAAVPLLERATELDPNFAMGYHYLGVAFENAGDVERSLEYTGKAFGLIDRVSEYERDNIAEIYYSYRGESDKAIDANRLGIQNYPRWWGFHNLLSVEYIDLGQFEEGLKEGQEAAQLDPRVEPPYRRQLDALICLDRLPEAKKLAEKVRKLEIDGARIHQRFLEIAYVEGDDAAAAREIQWFAGTPAEYLSLGLQAAHQNALGRRRESSNLYLRAAETARRHGLRNAAAEFEEADARADALSGNCQTARRLGRPALALALCGDAAQAEKLAGETSKLFPNGTIWNSVQLPELRAAIELQRDQPGQALELLASASPYERAYPEVPYLRGLAYLRMRKGEEAATEFQKILDHKGASWGSTWLHPNWGLYYSLSYLGLARAAALAGDPGKAGKAYRAFLTLWKDADPDIPILQQAKAESSGQP